MSVWSFFFSNSISMFALYLLHWGTPEYYNIMLLTYLTFGEETHHIRSKYTIPNHAVLCPSELNLLTPVTKPTQQTHRAKFHLFQGTMNILEGFYSLSDMVTMRKACSLNERSLLYKCSSCIRLETTCNLSLRRSMPCYLNWCKLLLSGHGAGV